VIFLPIALNVSLLLMHGVANDLNLMFVIMFDSLNVSLSQVGQFDLHDLVFLNAQNLVSIQLRLQLIYNVFVQLQLT